MLAADWPEFRGPTGQGLVTEGKLPLEWSDTKNVVWKKALPGHGWSSPVVAGGRIYLTTAVPVEGTKNDQSLRALCLDAKSGDVLWNEEVFHQDGAKAPGIHSKNSHASPTPVVQDGWLYVHFGHQGIACLDLTGKVVWKNDRLKYRPVHGNGGSPIVVGDLLVFSCDGGDQRFVVALERKNGEVKWKTARTEPFGKGFSFHTPLLITVNGKKQIVSAGSGAVCAYDLEGKEIWKVRYDGYSVIPRPVYGHGLVFLSSGYDAPTLLAIRPDGTGDVTATHVKWQTRKGAPHTPSPLLVGNELYVVSDRGLASCYDAKEGTERWSQRIGGNYSASPTYCDGKVYFQSEDGDTVVVKAGTKFERLGQSKLGERTFASFAVADGALFLRGEKHLYRIEEK
jgi:outer membrane protein assembly factor BamB